MRGPLTAENLQLFMKALAESAKATARVYLVGGASAVLLGWRDSTIDVDLKIIPESDETLRAIPRLKEQLQINIELASPDDFIPPLPDWQERSRFIQREGRLSFYHYDFYAQALAKLERRFPVDLSDVETLFKSGLIDPAKLLDLFSAIERELYRYPAVDRASFRKAVEETVTRHQPN
jgi:hypothetical protein